MNFKRIQYQALFKGGAIRITADLLIESLKSRRACNNVSQALKGNNCHTKFLANVSEIISSILSEHNGIKLETESNIPNLMEVEQHTIERLMKKAIKIFLEIN